MTDPQISQESRAQPPNSLAYTSGVGLDESVIIGTSLYTWMPSDVLRGRPRCSMHYRSSTSKNFL